METDAFMQRARTVVEAYCRVYILDGDVHTPVLPRIEMYTRMHRDWRALVGTDLMDGYGKTWLFEVHCDLKNGQTFLQAFKKIDGVAFDLSEATDEEIFAVLAHLKEGAFKGSNVTEVIDSPAAKIHASHTTKWVEGGTVLTCITCKLCSCHDRDEALTKPCNGK